MNAPLKPQAPRPPIPRKRRGCPLRTRCLSDEGGRRPSPLCRQGPQPAPTPGSLFQNLCAFRFQDRCAGGADRRHRDHSHPHRKGSPHPRVESHQAPQAALQRGAQGRQALPSLRLDSQEDYARFTVVRKIGEDDALYFGPFASAHAVRETLKVLNRTFKLRKCKASEFRTRTRPCLHCQLNGCLAPCCRDVRGRFIANRSKRRFSF